MSQRSLQPQPHRRFRGSEPEWFSFETTVIERYRRRGIGAEEALIGLCLTGASVRCMKDISLQERM